MLVPVESSGQGGERPLLAEVGPRASDDVFDDVELTGMNGRWVGLPKRTWLNSWILNCPYYKQTYNYFIIVGVGRFM